MEEFKHITPVQLRFQDFDMLGHVNNSVYLQLLDVAKTAYFKEVTGKTPTAGSSCPVVAHIDMDFENPLLYPEAPEVATRVSAIGTKSITLEQFILADGRVKCRVRTVMVNIDLRTGATVEISPEDRRNISLYEGTEL